MFFLGALNIQKLSGNLPYKIWWPKGSSMTIESLNWLKMSDQDEEFQGRDDTSEMEMSSDESDSDEGQTLIYFL